jgi:hypothetical protein
MEKQIDRVRVKAPKHQIGKKRDGELAVQWDAMSQILRRASSPWPARDGKMSRSRWKEESGARTFHGEKRESCLVRGQSSRFSLAVTGAEDTGIARPSPAGPATTVGGVGWGSPLSAAAAAPPASPPRAGSCRCLKISLGSLDRACPPVWVPGPRALSVSGFPRQRACARGPWQTAGRRLRRWMNDPTVQD